MSKINENSDEYIFRAISEGQKSKLKKRDVTISYTRIRGKFIQLFNFEKQLV